MERRKEIRDSLLEEVLKRLKEKLGDLLVSIILYGSRARGDVQPDSDYDLIVVLRSVPEGINDLIDEICGEILYEYGAIISVICLTEKELQQQTYNPFLMNVNKEGVLL